LASGGLLHVIRIQIRLLCPVTSPNIQFTKISAGAENVEVNGIKTANDWFVTEAKVIKPDNE